MLQGVTCLETTSVAEALFSLIPPSPSSLVAHASIHTIQLFSDRPAVLILMKPLHFNLRPNTGSGGGQPVCILAYATREEGGGEGGISENKASATLGVSGQVKP